MTALMVVPVPIPGGEVTLMLPDRVSGIGWVSAEKMAAEEHALFGYPAGSSKGPDVGLACRCGQSTVSSLRVRLGPRRKVLCVDCASTPLPVGCGDTVTFRLADSDLFPYVTRLSDEDAQQVELTGVVEHLSNHELQVLVHNWPVHHGVDFDDLTERPATMEDMREAWPDHTDEQLESAAAVLKEAGALTVVTSVRRNHHREEPDD